MTATRHEFAAAEAGLAGSLLGREEEGEASLQAGRQLGVGLCLASAYGLAIGAGGGLASALQHALGVPLGLASVALLGVPSLWVFLSLFDVPIQVGDLTRNIARSVASAGVVLAGLAPAAALYVVTSGPGGARFSAGLGLAVAVVLGGARFLSRLGTALRSAGAGSHLAALGAISAFTLFSLLLILRVWGAALPLFGVVS